eukprot:s256_g2.t1
MRVKRSPLLLHLRVLRHRCQWQNLPTGSRGISSWNRWGPKWPPGAFLGSQAANYHTGLPFPVVPASSKIHLLVDADAHGIDVIRQGISCLEKEGYEVHTLPFAPPGRESNRKWKRFISEPGVTFRPVPRATTYSNEPNDDAIISAMMKPSSFMADAASLALLTSDAGFIGPARNVQESGMHIVMLIPAGRIGVVKKYEAAGLQVKKLDSNDAAPKVRAVLHKDGSGSVHMADAFELAAKPLPNEEVETFLGNFGFEAHEGNLIQKCAKHWFENCAGPITVYPPQLAVLAVHKIMQAAESQSGKAYHGHLAYFLPVVAGGATKTLGKHCQMTFGSALARRVWKGGGPFMKQDSPMLVPQALEELGYEVNTDLREAMFCFINRAANKTSLRQIGMLPVSGDRMVEVTRKVRAAFLSNSSAGVWQVNKPGVSEMDEIVHILRKAGLLPGSHAKSLSQEDLIPVMKVYANKRGLPLMQTFDALALRIRHHNDASPTLRQLLSKRVAINESFQEKQRLLDLVQKRQEASARRRSSRNVFNQVVAVTAMQRIPDAVVTPEEDAAESIPSRPVKRLPGYRSGLNWVRQRKAALEDAMYVKMERTIRSGKLERCSPSPRAFEPLLPLQGYRVPEVEPGTAWNSAPQAVPPSVLRLKKSQRVYGRKVWLETCLPWRPALQDDSEAQKSLEERLLPSVGDLGLPMELSKSRSLLSIDDLGSDGLASPSRLSQSSHGLEHDDSPRAMAGLSSQLTKWYSNSGTLPAQDGRKAMVAWLDRVTRWLLDENPIAALSRFLQQERRKCWKNTNGKNVNSAR